MLTRCAEVQAKKVFTAEELSMRRAEMARRRRNLSEKRNEEVKVSYNSQSDMMSCTFADYSSDGNYQQAPQEASPQDKPT